MIDIKFQYNDGGRADAGYKGKTGDCVVRAIAIASGKPYQEVYDAINLIAKDERVTKKMRRRSASRTGVYRKTYEKYLKTIGFKWIPTMQIGQGCTVHLRPDELPVGRIIVRVTSHVTTMIDGVINDTYDPSRGGTRCVYGYYIKENQV